MEEKFLFSSNNNLEIMQVCDVLKENNIPFIRKEQGAMAYLNLAYGQAFGGANIFVSEEDFEKAQKLIEFLNFNEDNFEGENTEELSEEDIPEELREVEEESEEKVEENSKDSDQNEEEVIEEKDNKQKNMPKKIIGFTVIAIFAMFVTLVVVELIKMYFR